MRPSNSSPSASSPSASSRSGPHRGASHGRSPRGRAQRSSRSAGRAGGWTAWVDFTVLLALLALCALGGGSSFADVPSLLYVRPAAVLALLAFALTPARISWATYRAPLLMLGALAALIAAQLVPLPPAWWAALPGRAPYHALAVEAGVAQLWRPLSLTPDLTANSLAALVVPAAALIGFAKLDAERRRLLVIALVVLCGASAALGVAQLAGGVQSPLYLYRRTYQGFAVGFLANRNHQAALLATVFPALRVWTLMPAASRPAARRRGWLALAVGVAVIPAILATGSRAGILLSAVSLLATFLAFPARAEGGGETGNETGNETGDDRGGRRARLIRIGAVAGTAGLVGLSYLLGRAASIDRLSTAPAIGDDLRFRFAPVVIRIIRQTFPAGTGWGSFDPVFRQYEPDAILIASYFNHAHNELLELAMTGGLAGLALLAVFGAWWAVRTAGAVRDRWGAGGGSALLGALFVAIVLGASLVDYPLRTPLISGLFAIACGWLAAGRRPAL